MLEADRTEIEQAVSAFIAEEQASPYDTHPVLRERIAGEVLEAVRLKSPFLVRTVDPPIAAAEGKRVRGVRRLGKRVVVALDDDLYLVIHLMIAGRFRWEKRGAKVSRPPEG